MGAKVSGFKHPKALTCPINRSDPTPQSSITKLLKPECLKKLTRVETMTLEEYLLASPSFDQVFLVSIHVGEVCVFEDSSSKVHPSCSGPVDDAALSMRARDILPLERWANMHIEVEDKCPSEACNMTHGENGRSMKRVRFRLPQESDIILFYSPREQLECDEESDAKMATFVVHVVTVLGLTLFYLP
ncbi:hypothetical protein ACJRO7_022023 [Eucalyptus globulus]|uniref:Uncharacterized protein n=1 Tax=Eucalyptus globulus TaxID=34317 RepID=A0ABD3KRA6_EUCGL